MAFEYLKVIAENIPAELKSLKQWVVWETRKPDTKGGKEKKVPFAEYHNKDTGALMYAGASISSPETWMTFEEALACLKKHRAAKGLNFALTEESGIVGVDIDRAINAEGNKDENKYSEIKALKTYTELSPSGKGLRAFCFGTFPDGETSHQGDFETYKGNHFLSVTGNKLKDAPNTVNNVQEALTEFRARYFKQAIAQIESKLPVTPIELVDQEIIDRLANSKTVSTAIKFRKLFFNGDIKEYANDHSSADMALVCELMFYTQKEAQIDSIVRKSKLYRPEKWDRNAGYLDGVNVTYGQRTIRIGLRNRKDVFKGDVKESEVSIDLFPYKITTEGIFKKVPSKDNPQEMNDVRISSTPCKIAAIGDNVDTGEILYKLCVTDTKKRENTYWKTASDLLTRAGVIDLIKCGMVFKEPNALDIETLFDEYIQNYAQSLPEEIAASRNGWKQNNKLFVCGNYGYTAEGPANILQIENPIAELYTEKGSLEEWVEGLKDLFKFPVMHMKAYIACTPAILQLINTASFLVEQCVCSGRMKTESSKVSASIWGEPIGLQLSAESTKCGVLAQVNLNNCMPNFIDEAKMNDEVRDLVYLIANETGRTKSNKNQGLVRAPTWSTVALLTCENPILPENAHTGELVRVIPLHWGIEEKFSSSTVSKITNTYLNNYGHVGKLFLQKVFKNKDILKGIYEDVLTQFPEVEDITSERAKRFYAAIATAGILLENVFKEIGVESMDALELCKNLYKENVISSAVFEPTYIKALRNAYSFFARNIVYFQDEEETNNGVKQVNHERYGWIRGDCVCFDPKILKKALEDEKYNFEGIKKDWGSNKILITREEGPKDKRYTSLTVTIDAGKVNDKPYRPRVLKIPFAEFEKYNAAEESKENDIKEKDDRETLKPSNKANTKYLSELQQREIENIKTLNEFEDSCTTEEAEEDGIKKEYTYNRNLYTKEMIDRKDYEIWKPIFENGDTVYKNTLTGETKHRDLCTEDEFVEFLTAEGY